MPTFTTNFSFYKPAEGDGQVNAQQWAEGMNGNLDEIDALLKSLQPARATTSITTASLAAGATGWVEVAVAKATELLAIATDHPAEVRIYNTAAARAADAARPSAMRPTSGQGIVCQVTTPWAVTGGLVVQLDPVPLLANRDAVVASTAYLAVTNRDSTPRAITVTLTHLPSEP